MFDRLGNLYPFCAKFGFVAMAIILIFEILNCRMPTIIENIVVLLFLPSLVLLLGTYIYAMIYMLVKGFFSNNASSEDMLYAIGALLMIVTLVLYVF